ncbi:MAG: hypothetical protein ACO3ND_08115, partial [Opitutales bacterium]
MTAPHPSLFRRLVLREFARLRNGRLDLVTPEGETLRFGDPAVASGARLTVKDDGFFRRIVLSADIGLTESYMDGEWDSPDLAAVIAFFIDNLDHAAGMSGSARRNAALGVLRVADRIGHLLRPNSRK